MVIGSIVIRVDDLAAQLAFWTQALDYVAREPVDVDFALLRPRSGPGVSVSLDAVASERVLPPRIHLDLYAQDQDAEVARLQALGARRVRWDKQPADADYVIMEDPEGNRFCVVDATGWSGWAAHDAAS
ncbi:MAG: glyoxalase [Microbacterium sp. SCN 70-200]|nr:MAG: glyoxalase [Microbacterium sp. SCN 70-200]OJV81760.1 MAG: glyoxalase [Microbacterium sp. 70-16]